MPSPLPVTGAATIPDYLAITAPVSPDRPAPPQPATADRTEQTAPSRPRQSPMERALRDRHKEGAANADFPHAMELNLFDQAFGEQLDGSNRRLTGDFPPDLQPHISVEFHNKIRSAQPQSEALQKVIDRVLDPSAYELRYDHLTDDVLGEPRIPGYAILHCRPPQTQDAPDVNLRLIYKPDTEEVTRIQLRDKNNEVIWECAALVDAPTGTKRKHSELNEGFDIVPQYDQIKPKAEVTSLLLEQPDIAPIGLVKRLHKKPWTDHQTSGAKELSRQFTSTRTTITHLVTNLADFYTKIEDSLGTLEPEARIRAAAFSYLLENVIYDQGPVEKLFSSNNVNIKGSYAVVRKIQLRLIKRYLSSPEMRKEEAVDAFLNIALEIKKEGKDSALIHAVMNRPDFYKLDGDKELRAAYIKIPEQSALEEERKWKIVVTLPEIARKLRYHFTLEQMYSVMTGWDLPPDSTSNEDDVRIRKLIENELPLGRPQRIEHFMNQLAVDLV